MYVHVYLNNNNSINFSSVFIYVLSRQPKDRLWSEHKQKEEPKNTYTLRQKKIDCINHTMMKFELVQWRQILFRKKWYIYLYLWWIQFIF
jgi:hypothetical protein